jgi:hypothetical protein
MNDLKTLFWRAIAFSSASALRLARRGGQAHRRDTRDVARHHRIDQRAPRGGADQRQHVTLLLGVGADVAGGEQRVVFEFCEGSAGGHQHEGVKRSGCVKGS